MKLCLTDYAKLLVCRHEQIANRKADSNSHNALRGVIHALDLTRGWRIDQYSGQVAS